MSSLRESVNCECGFDFAPYVRVQITAACTARFPPLISTKDSERNVSSLGNEDNLELLWDSCVGCGVKFSEDRRTQIIQYASRYYHERLRAAHAPFS